MGYVTRFIRKRAFLLLAAVLCVAAPVASGESFWDLTPDNFDYDMRNADTDNQSPDYNVSLGTNLAFPFISLAYCATPTLAISLMPNYVWLSYQGLKTQMWGAMLGFHYYAGEYFRGFWLQLAAGVYQARSHYDDKEGNQVAETGLVTAGYRWRWESLNLGVAAGAQLYHLERSQRMPYLANIVWPAAMLDLGWTF